MRDGAWATAVATELLSEARELETECPEDGEDLEAFCLGFLRDLEVAGGMSFPLAIGLE